MTTLVLTEAELALLRDLVNDEAEKLYAMTEAQRDEQGWRETALTLDGLMTKLG